MIMVRSNYNVPPNHRRYTRLGFVYTTTGMPSERNRNRVITIIDKSIVIIGTLIQYSVARQNIKSEIIIHQNNPSLNIV